jgi:hypothetical protein
MADDSARAASRDALSGVARTSVLARMNALDSSLFLQQTGLAFAEGESSQEIATFNLGKATDSLSPGKIWADLGELALFSMTTGTRAMVAPNDISRSHIIGDVEHLSGPDTAAYLRELKSDVEMTLLVTNVFQALTKKNSVVKPSVAFGWHSTLDRILKELGRLTDGWAGPDSRAPGKQAQDNIQRVGVLFPANTLPPGLEVDPDDGEIVLTWANAKTRAAFSLSFDESKFVTGVISSNHPDWWRPWKCSVASERDFLEHLEHSSVRQMLLADD